MPENQTAAGVKLDSTPLLAKPIVSTLCMECHKPMSQERAGHFSYCDRCVHDAVETIIKYARKLERMANAAHQPPPKA